MSLAVVLISVERGTRVRTPSGGKTESFSPLPGSPFPARLYRRAQTNVNRMEGGAGVTTLDDARVLGFIDPETPVQIGDVAVLLDGTRARIQRVRRYDWRCECDLETGATP